MLYRLRRMDLHGRTVLFSGGATPLDHAIQRELERARADLILHGAAGPGERTSRGRLGGSKAKASVGGDAASAAGSAEIIARAWQLRGRLAGTVIHPFAMPLDGDWDAADGSWMTLVASGLKGPFFLARAAGLRMAPGGGRLVFVVERAQDEASGRSAAGVVAAGLLTLAGGLAKALRPAVSVATVLIEGSAGPNRTTDDQETARTVRFLLTERKVAGGAVIELGTTRNVCPR